MPNIGQQHSLEKSRQLQRIALQIKGQAMPSGNVFCAHCGGRLTTIRQIICKIFSCMDGAPEEEKL